MPRVLEASKNGPYWSLGTPGVHVTNVSLAGICLCKRRVGHRVCKLDTLEGVRREALRPNQTTQQTLTTIKSALSFLNKLSTRLYHTTRCLPPCARSSFLHNSIQIYALIDVLAYACHYMTNWPTCAPKSDLMCTPAAVQLP